ncbi:hypothetical protein D9Q98_003379 [Chlorella vulgaris]|uniref:Sm domain-containing protein n=1 Tax=Chlorella vulgaris TaxID=3077 RepID=A0A9D4TT05_CHLVU|nr:hypothetical protein D9Q98_003379 [Chlorella vulgaris]
MAATGEPPARGAAVPAAQQQDQQQQMRSPAAEQAAVLLHKRCKVQVKDGRVLVGDFSCLDRLGNIILSNTYEHMQLNGEMHEKVMGQVLVPASHRVSCEFAALPCDDELRALLQQKS